MRPCPCFLSCLPACLLAFLPAFVLALLLACSRAFLLSCLLACAVGESSSRAEEGHKMRKRREANCSRRSRALSGARGGCRGEQEQGPAAGRRSF